MTPAPTQFTAHQDEVAMVWQGYIRVTPEKDERVLGTPASAASEVSPTREPRSHEPSLIQPANGQQTSTPGPSEQLADEDELLRRFARTRDPAVMEEIVRRFMPFARSLALRYRGGTEQIDDLVQVANLGLVQAIERFDPDRGAAFKSFAAPTILGELKRHFRDRVWNLRLPRGLQERILKLEGTATELTGKLERPPTVRELAEALNLDQTEVLEAFEAVQTRRTLSFDQPVTIVGTPEEGTVGEQVGTEDPHYEGVEDLAAVQASLPGLTEREVYALRLRFVEDLTQSQIAERIGCSQVHVSRILRGALQRLRERAEPGAADSS